MLKFNISIVAVSIASCVLLGVTSANNDINRDAQVLHFNNVPADAEGNYAYSFDTTNGISIQAAGNAAGTSGAIQYVSSEGLPITWTYTADEDGFHPSGEHLPIAPPIPEIIVRSLEYIRTHPSATEGQVYKSSRKF